MAVRHLRRVQMNYLGADQAKGPRHRGAVSGRLRLVDGVFTIM